MKLLKLACLSLRNSYTIRQPIKGGEQPEADDLACHHAALKWVEHSGPFLVTGHPLTRAPTESKAVR